MFDSRKELLDKIRLREDTCLEVKEVRFSGRRISEPHYATRLPTPSPLSPTPEAAFWSWESRTRPMTWSAFPWTVSKP